jgi:hypothetical protein
MEVDFQMWVEGRLVVNFFLRLKKSACYLHGNQYKFFCGWHPTDRWPNKGGGVAPKFENDVLVPMSVADGFLQYALAVGDLHEDIIT